MKKSPTVRLWSGLLTVAISFSGLVAAQEPAPKPEQNPSQTPPPQNQTSPPAQAPAETPAPTAPPAAPYQPKFPGDPAHSESEAQALGYMRVVLRAQKEYKKRHDKYAPTLLDLAGTGSLTKRMARSTDRGDYTVGFKTQKDGFVLALTPKQMDADHRSFYAEDDGVIHADDQKPADSSSPKIK